MRGVSMEMSDNTADLFAAYAKFQGDLSNATKAKSGHGYKYADLATCIDVAKDPLKNNGLAVAQFLGKCEQGTTLTTMMTHASGQWMRDTFIMEKAVLQGGAGKNPAQAMGASITYMRRYSYAAICGMTQEDEDAARVKAKNNASNELNDFLGMLDQAIQTGDAEYIANNWNGSIAKHWNQLGDQRIAILNKGV